MKKKVGVVLSGCGVFDGSEIHESVLALLAITRNGAEAVCMAPNSTFKEIDHLTGQPTGATRNVLVESARIARGKIRDVATVKAEELDALIFPGGFGAAKNLCDFAEKGAGATVHPEVARLMGEVVRAQKPVGAICIAPALVAAALGKEYAPTVTIGNDPGTAAAIEQTGAHHATCPVSEFVVDREHKIVSTPAYMLAENIGEAAEGIEKLVAEVIALI